MASIQVDDQTAKILEERALEQGMSVAEYLRTVVPPPASPVRPAWDKIEREILALSTAGNALPKDFSRKDIYG
jgi:hypothetical protein